MIDQTIISNILEHYNEPHGIAVGKTTAEFSTLANLILTEQYEKIYVFTFDYSYYEIEKVLIPNFIVFFSEYLNNGFKYYLNRSKFHLVINNQDKECSVMFFDAFNKQSIIGLNRDIPIVLMSKLNIESPEELFLNL